MRGRAATKDLAGLLKQAAGTPPEQPALMPWERRLSDLKTHVVRITRSCMDFAKLVQASLDEKDYEHFGYAGPGEFFEEKLGMAWRSIYRYLAPMKAIAALPEGEQAAATEKLSRLGVHKSAAIAPAIQKDPASFDAWVDKATIASQASIQEQVSTALGVRPRGSIATAADPGESTLQFLLRRMPPELATSWEAAFRAWVRHEQFTSTISGLCNLELLMRTKIMQDKGELPE